MNDESLPDLLIQPVSHEDEPAVRALASGANESAAVSGPGEAFWAAYRQRRLVGVLRVVVHPGRTSTVGVPRLVAGEAAATAVALLSHATRLLEAQGIQMVQALSHSDHGADADALRGGGLRHVANLLYLVSLPAAFPEAPPATDLEFVSYALQRHAQLARIVERTYAGSRDCPAIDQGRAIDDVLAGYRACGAFDSDRWLLVRRAGADVGCLLLTDDPLHESWEVTYMGVVPEARGCGLGLAVTRHAQWLARRAGRGRVTLAVDADNTPALDVYAEAGFTAWDERCVWLRMLTA